MMPDDRREGSRAIHDGADFAAPRIGDDDSERGVFRQCRKPPGGQTLERDLQGQIQRGPDVRRARQRGHLHADMGRYRLARARHILGIRIGAQDTVAQRAGAVGIAVGSQRLGAARDPHQQHRLGRIEQPRRDAEPS